MFRPDGSAELVGDLTLRRASTAGAAGVDARAFDRGGRRLARALATTWVGLMPRTETAGADGEREPGATRSSKCAGDWRRPGEYWSCVRPAGHGGRHRMRMLDISEMALRLLAPPGGRADIVDPAPTNKPSDVANDGELTAPGSSRDQVPRNVKAPEATMKRLLEEAGIAG